MKISILILSFLAGCTIASYGQPNTAQEPLNFSRELPPIRGHYKELAALSPDPTSSHEPSDKLKFPFDQALADKVLRHKPFYLTNVTVDDFKLPDPPANSSVRTRAELNYLLGLQHHRTPEDIRESLYLSDHLDYFTNAGEIGRSIGYWTGPQKLPVTDSLLENLSQDATYFLWALKFKYQRPRPYMLEPLIHDLEESHASSYPGGHVTYAYICAFVYQELAPEFTDFFLQKAGDMAHARETIGVHYPSDSEASRIFARQLVNKLFLNEKFLQDFGNAKKEWLKKINENSPR